MLQAHIADADDHDDDDDHEKSIGMIYRINIINWDDISIGMMMMHIAPVALFNFSPLCLFICFLKLTASEDVPSHWLHLLDFSSLCLF